MSTERTQVLSMLADGTITVEQASQLLEALGEGQTRERQQWNRPQQAETQGQRSNRTNRDRMRASLDQITSMRAVGVDADYVRELRELGLPDLSADQITNMRAVGVDADYVRELRELGLPDLSADDLASMRAVGVDADYIRELRELGLPDLSVEQITTMKLQG